LDVAYICPGIISLTDKPKLAIFSSQLAISLIFPRGLAILTVNNIKILVLSWNHDNLHSQVLLVLKTNLSPPSQLGKPILSSFF
jgi:hypothetical protein